MTTGRTSFSEVTGPLYAHMVLVQSCSTAVEEGAQSCFVWHPLLNHLRDPIRLFRFHGRFRRYPDRVDAQAMLIRVDDGPLTLTAPAGQESVGARVTRLRKRASREVLDPLTGEARAVHGAASVSQHESQA